MGTCVSACPANATRPMRSEDRARTNSVAVRRATSSRLAGEKSSASMLLEISTASTIEIPSLGSSARAPPRARPPPPRPPRDLKKPLAPPPPPQRQRREQQQQQGSREAHADD